MARSVVAGAFAAAFTWFAAEYAAPAQAADRCTNMTKFSLPDMAVAISKVGEIPAGDGQQTGPIGPVPRGALPAHCRIEGTINAHKGTDGKNYGIRFALALPDVWAGEFLYQGGGGLDGTLFSPIGSVAAGNTPALARGFAIVASDSGHESTAELDDSFFADQQASLDFEYASLGEVTRLAKTMIAHYYGKPPHHSYFAGCSTGGREAMLAVERYPLLFDGAIAGDPSMHNGIAGIGDDWVRAAFDEIAPKDATGRPISAAAFSESDKKLIVNGILDACDAEDDLKDGMIFNRRACKFEPKSLQCKAAKTDACLSKAQVNALDKAFVGPKNAQGTQIYPGFPFDTGIASMQGVPGLLNNAPGPVGPGSRLDVDTAYTTLMANPLFMVGDTANWTNLSTFSAHGGKLIFFHGVSDPWFSALDTIDYYERMSAANGGPARARDFARLFLVPGMGHCGGGPATLDEFDALTLLIDWVEHGKAPESLTATGHDFPGRSRPLCAYPKHAQYKGSGDPNDAANFGCKD